MTDDTGDLKNSWGWFLALGILMLIGGVCAFLAPFLVSILVEMIVGVFLVIGGLMTLAQMFSTKDGWSARVTYFVLGLFNTVAGLLLWLRPLEGLLALTLILIVAFLVSGLLRVAVGIMARPEPGSGWVIFGGAVSVIAAIYLFTQYPEISIVFLGIVAGVTLISEGVGYIRFAIGLRDGAPAPA